MLHDGNPINKKQMKNQEKDILQFIPYHRKISVSPLTQKKNTNKMEKQAKIPKNNQTVKSTETYFSVTNWL